MDNRITFKCAKCGTALTVSKANPPNDDDIISCRGCGHVFGPYADVREAIIKAGKEEVAKLTRDTARGLFKGK